LEKREFWGNRFHRSVSTALKNVFSSTNLPEKGKIKGREDNQTNSFKDFDSQIKKDLRFRISNPS
jgi:hypothetical protein